MEILYFWYLNLGRRLAEIFSKQTGIRRYGGCLFCGWVTR